MTFNSLLNATIALIRGDMPTVREILRSPGSDVKDVPATVARLYRELESIKEQAIRAYKAKLDTEALIKELTAIQVDCLGIQEPSVYEEGLSKAAFFGGVCAVEDLISNRIKRYRSELSEPKYD